MHAGSLFEGSDSLEIRMEIEMVGSMKQKEESQSKGVQLSQGQMSATGTQLIEDPLSGNV